MELQLQKILTREEINFIEMGKDEYEFFLADLAEAFENNPFGENFIFSSPPGFSKSFSTNKKIKELGLENQVLEFNGDFGLFSFAADTATALLRLMEFDPHGTSKIYCKLDDSDSLFDRKNINVTKNMFQAENGRKRLEYRKVLGGQYASLDDSQKAAIDHFREEGRAGFSIPVDRFVFIVLTNKSLANTDDIEKASDFQKESKKAEAAIHRRVQYKGMKFQPGVDWGYCAHIFMNYPMAEQWKPNITLEEKLEVLRFTSPTNNWHRIKDRNLSVFDKMVKDMVRFPNNYYNRWVSQYLNR
jgi:hypothetical protein